jgi:tetratricopeptide (TPR) repeat protein
MLSASPNVRHVPSNTVKISPRTPDVLFGHWDVRLTPPPAVCAESPHVELINIASVMNMLRRGMLWALLLHAFMAPPTHGESASIRCASASGALGIAACRKAIDAFKSSAEAPAWLFNRLGVLLDERGDHKGAITSFDRAVESEPTNAGFLNNRGLARMHSEDYDGAADDFSAGLAQNSTDATILANRAAAWFRKRDFNRALEDYSEAIRLQPGDDRHRRDRALVFREIGDFESAMADASYAVAINPREARNFSARGETWLLVHEFTKAAEDFDSAIMLDPSQADFFVLRALTWEERGFPDRALKDSNQALLLEPKSARAHNRRGNAWSVKDHWTNAISDFTKAIELDPRIAAYRVNRGYAFYRTGSFGAAIADYDDAYRIGEVSADLFFNRGEAWRALGDFESAIRDYTEAIQLDTSQTRHYLARAAAWQRAGDTARAKTDLNAASRLSPKDPQVLAALDAIGKGKPIIDGSSAATRPVTIGSSEEKRVALIIGNSRYLHAPLLKNSVRDAAHIAEALQKVGFNRVILKSDLTREGLISALREFSEVANAADWALIYFAGHGVEFAGTNYLIPVDAQLRTDRDIGLEAIELEKLLLSTEGSTRLRLVILDACRDNPFVSSMERSARTRSMGRGLARVEPEAGTLVAYAAKHGEIALDGEGDNSPYTDALVRRILERPSLEIRRLFDFVRDDVLAGTDGRQQPFSYGSLSAREDFYFKQ